MKKVFKNRKRRILTLSIFSLGMLIPILATTAVACIGSNKNNQTINAVQKINSNDLGLTGTATSNFHNIVNNSNDFVFNNLNKFLSGDMSLITKNDASARNIKINSDKTSISFDLVIAPQKFYVNNNLSSKEFVQTITINGFQVLEVPEAPLEPTPQPKPPVVSPEPSTPPVIVPEPTPNPLPPVVSPEPSTPPVKPIPPKPAPTPEPDVTSPEPTLPTNPDVSTPNPLPPVVSPEPSTPNLPDQIDTFKVYDKFSDLINPNLNFINKNFKADLLDNGMYRKNYRLHQLLRNALWKFDKLNNSFSWSIDEQWIANMISRDGENVDNINLYLYVESLTSANAEEIDFEARDLFRDYLEKKNSFHHIPKFENVSRYNDDKRHYPLGIKIDWKKLKESKIMNILTPKYFDIKVQYDSDSKNILFQILAKKGITLTDEPMLAKKASHVFISSADNFLGLSFEANNNENRTFAKFNIPSKAEEGVNVNAFDRSSRLKGSNENRYIDSGFRIPQENLENPLVKEMNSRALSIIIGSKSGTYTMFSKVKPSDPEDMRYYLFTNQHVFWVKENNYEQEKASGFGLVKLINNQDFRFTVRSKAFTPFWGFNNFKDRWGKDVQNLTEQGDGLFRNWKRDVQVSIIDLKLVSADIEKALTLNQNKVQTNEIRKEASNLNSLKTEFSKWANLPPLEFTDRYKSLTTFSEYLEDAIMINYPKRVFINSKINKLTGGYSLVTFAGEENEPLLLDNGSSGSLIISGDRKIIAILNKGIGRDGIGQQFYSYQYDVIGSNIDGSNPSENVNPATFAKAVIEANKKYPDRFEVLDIFKNKS